MARPLLVIETHPEHPGLVRVLIRPALPAEIPEPFSPLVRYAARFDDIEAARMHAFSALRHRLVDVDASLFRVPVEEAVAAIEAIDLPHQRTYLDPDLEATHGQRIARLTAEARRRRRRYDIIWQWVGWIALAWLALLALSGF